MKTNTVITYSASELKEQFPDGFKRALQRHQDRGEIHWQDEIFDSLKACVEAAGLALRDWDLGLCHRGNHIRIDWKGDTAELSGPRAMAWLENNLFGPLRTGWTTKERAERRQYGKSYYAGLVPPCPLTGVCFDENYLETLTKRVRKGDTLKEAFGRLADTYVELLEAEYEAQNTEEYFIEESEACELQFTEDGEIF